MHSLGVCAPLGNLCRLEELLVWQLWEQGTSFAILLKQRFPLMCPEDL